MIKFLKDTYNIAHKDIMLEFRTREILSSVLVYVFLVVIVFCFIFEPGEHETKRIAGGVYWMALAFSGLLGLSKSMQTEIAGDNLSALLLTPCGRNSVFLGKVCSNMIFLLAVQFVMVILFAVLYEVNIVQNIYSLVIIFSATYGFVLLGTLFSLIAARTRTREIMLPILLLPVLIPVLLAAIQTTNAIIAGEEIAGYIKWLRLIIVYDIIFTAIALIIFETMVEE